MLSVKANKQPALSGVQQPVQGMPLFVTQATHPQALPLYTSPKPTGALQSTGHINPTSTVSPQHPLYTQQGARYDQQQPDQPGVIYNSLKFLANPPAQSSHNAIFAAAFDKYMMSQGPAQVQAKLGLNKPVTLGPLPKLDPSYHRSVRGLDGTVKWGR